MLMSSFFVTNMFILLWSQFTMEISINGRLNFLDIMLLIEDLILQDNFFWQIS